MISLSKRLISFCFVILFLFSLLSVALVHAQDLSGAGDNLKDTVGGLEDKVDNVKSFTEQDRLDYLTGRWQELLLKIPVVSKINDFFIKIDLFFVIFFARSWEISMDMFFTVILWFAFWLFFFNMLNGLIGKDKWYLVWIISLLGTVGLAWTQFINFLASLTTKLVFYKSGWTNIILFVLVLVLIVILSALGKRVSKNVGKNNENSEEEQLKKDVESWKAYRQGMEEVKNNL